MMDIRLITIYVLFGILIFISGLLLIDKIRISSLQKKYYLCNSQIEVQNAAIALKQKQDQELQKKLKVIEDSYEKEINEQQKRIKEIDNVPIIDDCTGAVRWGSRKAAALAATWAD